MEVNTSAQLTKEKQQAILISSYKQAVALLQGTHTRQQGRSILLSILHNPDSHENALRQLRISTLLSLAQLSKVQGQNANALYYWHEATKLEPAFNTWIKMAHVLESLRAQFLSASPDQKQHLKVGLGEIEDQIEYVYKNAIKESPKLWKQQLLEKLHQTYINHGKKLHAEDLHQVIMYKAYDEVTSLKESRQKHEGHKKTQNFIGFPKQIIQSLPQIEISHNRILRCSQVSPWDYMLTFCLFLMNSPSTLKRTSKKHDQVLSKLLKFNEYRTAISFKVKVHKENYQGREKMQQVCNQLPELSREKKQQEENRGQDEKDYDEKLFMLMVDYFKEINKEKQASGGKTKKPQNISQNYNNKSTFDSLQDYLKEISASKSINFALLHSFKYVDPAYNPRIQLLSNRPDSVFDATFSTILQEPKPSDKESQIEEESCPLVRQRRSISQGTPQQATPIRRQNSEQVKVQEQRQSKLKCQFLKFMQSIKQRKFRNILELSQVLVVSMLQVYTKYGLGDELSIEGTQEQRKTTSKLISQLIIKIIEVSETSILEDPNINRLAYILLARTMEDELNNPNSVSRMGPLQSTLLHKLTASIDSLIYANSHLRTPHRNSYSLEDLQQLLDQIYISILVCTLPSLPANEAKIKKLMKYYSKLHVLYLIEANQSDQLFLQSRIAEPSKVEEIIENRMRKLKIKEFGQQQSEQSILIANIDKLLKQDLKTSEIIDSVKTIISMGTGSLLLYLKSFAKVVEILFANLENNAGFNIRFIQNSLKAMEIPMLIQFLHSKLTQGKKSQKDPKEQPEQRNQEQNQFGNGDKPVIDINTIESQRSDYNIKIQTIYNLLKIYALNELDQTCSSLCLRIVFYLLQETFKTMADFQNTGPSELGLHYQYSDQICLIIIFLDSLVKMRESGELRKKFYHRILIKNIRYIYDLYNHATSGQNEIRVQVYKIYSQTFHHKSFKPKKMEDCLGYFLMISRQFSSEFDKQEVEFEQKMRKVFNECYLIFKQQFHKFFEECERFTRAMQYFVLVMRKKKKQCQQFVNFFTGKLPICDCCQGPYLRGNISKQPFAKEVFFVVAKFLENRRNTQKISTVNNQTVNQKQVQMSNKQSKKSLNLIELDDEIEKSYLRYFLVAVNTGKAWYEILRFQISKVYQCFDALIGPQIENNNESNIQAQTVSEIYKHKFKYAKTIASFTIKNFNSPDFAQAKQYALYRINLMNTLKICQRKFNRNLSEVEKVPSLTQQLRDKYMEGIVLIMKRKQQSEDQEFALGNNFPETSFLIYTQFKLPFVIYNCQNTKQLEANIKLLDLIIRQGFRLVKRIKANGKSIMVDENQEIESLMQSKFNIAHLDKALKVQILGALSQIILNALQFIENAASLMKEPPAGTKKKMFTRERLKDTPQSEEEGIQKLQLLLELSKVIQSIDSELQTWKQQSKDIRQIENPDKNLPCQEEINKQKTKLLEFKDKYLFPDYTPAINRIEKALEKFIKIFEGIAKQNIGTRLRKENYSRYIFLSKLWISKIYQQLGSKEASLSCIKDIANLKNEDLVSFYHHYENEPTEQNLVLAEYYSRDIVFHCLKIDAIQHLLQVYSSRPETLEICIMLIRKLCKMYSQKVEQDKDKSKAKNKQEGHKQNDLSKDKKNDEASKKKAKEDKDKQALVQPEQKQKVKKEGKQNKEGKEKGEKFNKLEIKIKWVHVLFLRGVQLYLQAFIKTINTKNEGVEQKYEKALLEFKNRIKREVEKDRKKPIGEITDGSKLYGINLVNDIQSFIQFYESKFDRKVRMKAPKKQKVQNTQTINQNQKIDQDINFSMGQNQMLSEKLRHQEASYVIKKQVGNSEQQDNLESENEDIENQNEAQIKREDEEDVHMMEFGLQGVPDQMIDEREVQYEDDSGNL